MTRLRVPEPLLSRAGRTTPAPLQRPRWALRILAVCAFAAAIAGVTAFRRSVLDYFCVTGESMEPTLLAGDCILVRRGRFTGPEAPPGRGAVVVLHLQPGAYVVKRLVAHPGDTVEVLAGRLLVNGAALDEPYAPRAAAARGLKPPGDWHYAFLLRNRRTAAYAPTSMAWGPVAVPESAFFVLGDNRAHSGDSRSFGFVGPGEIVGVPSRVVWSSEPRRSLLPRLRPGRIGTRL